METLQSPNLIENLWDVLEKTSHSGIFSHHQYKLASSSPSRLVLLLLPSLNMRKSIAASILRSHFNRHGQEDNTVAG